MAELSAWLLANLRDDPVHLADVDYLRQAAESFRTEANLLSLKKFDRVVFNFSMEAGFIGDSYPALPAEWRDAIAAASAAFTTRFDGQSGFPDDYTGLYMFWENVLGRRNHPSTDTSGTSQFVEHYLIVQLRDGNQMLKLAALHGLNHFGAKFAARAIAAAGIKLDAGDVVADFARDAMQGRLL